MRRLPTAFLTSLLLLILLVISNSPIRAQGKQPLLLVQTIHMPNVKGRIDHMDVDVKSKRLFVAGLENGSLEIVDLQAGQWLRSIPGFQKPQGVAYVSPLNKVFVASGDDAMLRIFRADTLDLVDSIKLEMGPNRVAYDPHTNLLYVGYGGSDAGRDYGEVGVIDAATNKHLGDVNVAAHPAELLLDHSGQTLFVFVTTKSIIQVINTKRREIVSTFPVSSQRPGDAAFDESTHRLFIGTRTPPEMIVMDSKSGKEVIKLPTVEGMDGVYFDAVRKRVYVSGGRGFDSGFVFVYQQKDADHCQSVAKIPTRAGAGTSFWSPQLNRYYVAAPAHENEEAAILVFEPQP